VCRHHRRRAGDREGFPVPRLRCAWHVLSAFPERQERNDADAEGDRALDPIAGKRLKEMLSFVESLDRWYAQMLTVPKPKLAALMRLGTRIVALLPLGKSK